MSRPEEVLLSSEPDNRRVCSYDAFDTENPEALVNLLSESLRPSVLALKEKHPEYFGLDERDLLNLLTKKKIRPTPTDNRLRLTLWNEYERARARGVPITMSDVSLGVCSPERLHAILSKHPEKLAWILTPPVSYSRLIEEGLEFGLGQLRDILELPHVDSKTNKINVPLIRTKAAIVKMLNDRAMGGVVNRNYNFNIDKKDTNAAKDLIEELSYEQLNKQLAGLVRKKESMSGSEEVIVE